MNTRNTSRGFTLIEMLVVIALILILMGIVVFALMPLVTQNKWMVTLTSIRVVEAGVERFQQEFKSRDRAGVNYGKGYPRKTGGVGQAIPDNAQYTFSAMHDGEWLRIMLAPTENDIQAYLGQFGIKRPVLKPEEWRALVNSQPVTIGPRNIAAQGCFIDAWDNTIFYRFPGEDHSAETNFKNQKGENFKAQQGRPDIWSAGADGVNWYDTANRAQWRNKVNDPYKPGDPNCSDDVPSWFPVDR